MRSAAPGLVAPEAVQTASASSSAEVSERMLPKGAVHVPTKAFTLAQTVAALAVEGRQIAGFFGEPGTGKTHALRYFAKHSSVECVYITASPNPQRKEVFEEILLALTGTFDDVPERQLRRDCATVLAERQRALVVDECQNLSVLWNQQLRELHDRTNAFALFLAGGSNAAQRIDRFAEIKSRIAMKVTFEPLAGQELLNVLGQYHPMLAATEDQLLLDVDAKDCRGNFRKWTHVLELALRLSTSAQHDRGLTPKIVKAVFAVRGGQ
jgi:DNA transposition AAA+ family ATPase